MMKMNEDHRKGALFGQAIGDALGVPWEFNFLGAPEGSLHYSTHATTEGFGPGEWSDDTEQALCILNALLSGGDLPLTLAGQLKEWYRSDGRGCGNNTSKVVNHPNFLTVPMAVSESIWEQSGRKSAANGGVMRTATVPIYRPWDIKWVVDTAVTACKVTHWDKRCQASCVAVSVFIAQMIMGDNIPHAVSLSRQIAERIDPDCVPYIEVDLDPARLTLDLSMKGSIGYTYKCLSAGFWAVREFQRCTDQQYEDLIFGEGGRFHDVLGDVIRAGGDTDTNGAVAGAMLGAVAGFKSIPRSLLEGLAGRKKLDQYMTQLPQQEGV